jgi:hypothetical protein
MLYGWDEICVLDGWMYGMDYVLEKKKIEYDVYCGN